MKGLGYLVALVFAMVLSFLIYKNTLQRPAAPASEDKGDSSDSLMTFSDEQVKVMIEEKRTTRSDLPEPFADYEWSVRRERLYYVYLESAVPQSLHSRNIIKLDYRGRVVDIIARDNINTFMECPEKVFTENELGEIIAKERASRNDVLPPFDRYRTRVSRLRCLYLYFEYNLPDRRGDYQVFTIDPFGGLMDFSRSEPY